MRNVKDWFLNHAALLVLVLGVPLLSYDAIDDIYRHPDAFILGTGIFAFFALLVITGINMWFLGWRKGRRQGRALAEMVVEQAVQTTLESAFMHYRLITQTVSELGDLCEVCGTREEEMGIGVIPGPGNPPLYFTVSVRCADHSDMERWPATHIISLESLGSPEGEA